MTNATDPSGEQPHHTGDQSVDSPLIVPPPIHPGAEFRKRKRAEHEAAHVVVTDDLGWEVQSADLQHMTADWGGFEAKLDATDWADAAQREAIKPDILKYVTMLVAGHFAEHEIDPTDEIISKKLEKNPEVLQLGPDGRADRDRTAAFLKRVHCNQLSQVIALEDQVREILSRRSDHLKAVAKFLFTYGAIAGADLRKALGN